MHLSLLHTKKQIYTHRAHLLPEVLLSLLLFPGGKSIHLTLLEQELVLYLEDFEDTRGGLHVKFTRRM
jgi:hypothetical protein